MCAVVILLGLCVLFCHSIFCAFRSIVGFYVEPLSIAHKFSNGATWDGKGVAPPLNSCSQDATVEFEDNRNHMRLPRGGGSVIFT